MSATWASKTTYPLGARPNVAAPLLPALSGAIKLNCLGDSETYGFAGYNNSYRLNLYNLLTDPARGNLSINMIGFQNHGTAPANLSHGVSGSTTAGATTGWNSGEANDAATPARSFATYAPDVCIVELGINDAADATLTTNFVANYTSLISYLNTLSPATRFVLPTLFWCGDPARFANVQTIQGDWAAIYANLDGAGIRYIPVSIYVISAYGTDQAASEAPNYLHWNDNGQLKIADALYPAVMNACGYDATW